MEPQQKTPTHNRDLDKAISIEAVRASGPGGQNVNKVSSKIRLRLALTALDGFSDEQKGLLRAAAGKRWKEKDDVIIMESQETRDQPQNLRLVKERLEALMTEALTPKKTRKKTRPTRSSKERRLKEKALVSRKKQARRSGGREE